MLLTPCEQCMVSDSRHRAREEPTEAPQQELVIFPPQCKKDACSCREEGASRTPMSERPAAVTCRPDVSRIRDQVVKASDSHWLILKAIRGETHTNYLDAF